LRPLLKLHIMKITHMLSLGKSYALTLCIFLFSTFIFGQTTIVNFPLTSNLNYSANPTPPAGTTLGYFNSNGVAKTPTFSGSWLKGDGSGEYLELSLDASNLTNLAISFDARFSSWIGNGTWIVKANTGTGGSFVEVGRVTLGSFLGSVDTESFLRNLPDTASGKSDLKIQIQVDFGWNLGDDLRLRNLKIISGTPNITVYNSLNPQIIIPNGAAATENYNTVFGHIQTTSVGESKLYKIRNYNGTVGSKLNVSDIVIEPSSGTTANDFVIESIEGVTDLSRVTSHTSTTMGKFNIRFTPQAEGVRSAVVKIYSNGVPSPYSFTVIGTGRSCNIQNTSYIINTVDNNTQTLSSDLTASDFIAGTSNAPAPNNILSTLYPQDKNLYVSGPSSYYVKDSEKIRNFGGSGVNISNLRNVSIEFNVAAFGKNSSTGVNSSDYVTLQIFYNGNWYEVMRLKGGSSSTRRRYAFNEGTTFNHTFNVNNISGNNYSNTAAENTANTKYNKFKLNIPLSISANLTNLQFRIKAKANAEAIWLIDDVQIKADNAEFKTYTVNGWVPAGNPNANQKVIIEGNYIVPAAGLNVCECEVMETGSVTIPSNRTLTVKGKIINHHSTGANFIVHNDGNLIQTEPGAINVGNINVFRKSGKMVRQDATFWSSPVEGQNLLEFSPNTLLKRFYLYNKYTEAGATSDYKSILQYDPLYPMPNPIPEDWYEEGELLGNVFDPAKYTFKKGWGYTIRVPNDWTLNAPGDEYEGKFVGTPHNGNVDVPVYGKFTVVGNPYPSSISYHAFMDFNQDVNSIHFWTHKFPVGSEYYDYGYLTVNKMGTTGLYPNPAGGDSISVDYNGSIKVGQGFLIKNVAQGASQNKWYVHFNNQMRMPSTGGVFYKNFDEPEAHKFWLGLYDSQDVKIAQILLGYMEGATYGFDKQYDAERMGASPFYSLMDEGKMAIQARALPFEHTDIILLGFVAKNTGSFKITLDDMTGLFAEGQEIYLKDKEANVLHNLSESDYSFTATQGTYHHRFEIIYKKKPSFIKSLTSVNKIELNKINHQIEINSSIDKITSIQVFNISGRLLLEENDINKLNFKIQTSGIEPSIIIVRGKTETGEAFNQKFIIN
jgi:hypothetical protein